MYIYGVKFFLKIYNIHLIIIYSINCTTNRIILSMTIQMQKIQPVLGQHGRYSLGMGIDHYRSIWEGPDKYYFKIDPLKTSYGPHLGFGFMQFSPNPEHHRPLQNLASVILFSPAVVFLNSIPMTFLPSTASLTSFSPPFACIVLPRWHHSERVSLLSLRCHWLQRTSLTSDSTLSFYLAEESVF